MNYSKVWTCWTSSTGIHSLRVIWMPWKVAKMYCSGEIKRFTSPTAICLYSSVMNLGNGPLLERICLHCRVRVCSLSVEEKKGKHANHLIWIHSPSAIGQCHCTHRWKTGMHYVSPKETDALRVIKCFFSDTDTSFPTRKHTQTHTQTHSHTHSF